MWEWRSLGAFRALPCRARNARTHDVGEEFRLIQSFRDLDIHVSLHMTIQTDVLVDLFRTSDPWCGGRPATSSARSIVLWLALSRFSAGTKGHRAGVCWRRRAVTANGCSVQFGQCKNAQRESQSLIHIFSHLPSSARSGMKKRLGVVEVTALGAFCNSSACAARWWPCTSQQRHCFLSRTRPAALLVSPAPTSVCVNWVQGIPCLFAGSVLPLCLARGQGCDVRVRALLRLFLVCELLQSFLAQCRTKKNGSNIVVNVKGCVSARLRTRCQHCNKRWPLFLFAMARTHSSLTKALWLLASFVSSTSSAKSRFRITSLPSRNGK